MSTGDEAVARDPAVSPAVLRQMAAVASDAVRDRLAHNPNVPWDVLTELWIDRPGAMLQNPVVTVGLLEDPQLLAKLPVRTAVAVLGLERLSSFFVERLSRHPADEVRAALMAREDLRPSTIERVARDFFHYEWAARHPDTPTAYLEELRAHAWASVRLALVDNPRLPRGWLEALANDDDEKVRRAATARLEAK